MEVFYFYGTVVAGMLLYANTVSIMKKVKNGLGTERIGPFKLDNISH